MDRVWRKLLADKEVLAQIKKIGRQAAPKSGEEVAELYLFLNQISKITFIRGPLLIPFITLLILIGAFAEKNAMMDILLMLTFGLLGLVMVHFDWPRPPIVLGLVLGDLAETYLFLSTDRYGWYWLLDPLVLGLLLLAVVVVFYPSFRSRRQA